MNAILQHTVFYLALLAGAARAHWDYAPFLEPHVKTPLYGRYAGMTPATDPRMNKELQEMFKKYGVGGVLPDFDFGPDWEEAKRNVGPMVEQGFGALFGAIVSAKPKFKDTRRDITIEGVDGNQIPLQIYQGTSKTCYYLTHGGGMGVFSSRDPWYTSLANKMSGEHGMTVVAVDFRNFLHHPDPNLEIAKFPAGLNDIYSGLEWLHEHKSELGCETVVNFGESGGGNLCLALALKTVKQGRTDLTDGSYCVCPMPDGDFFSQRTPSMSENNGYFLGLLSEATQNNWDMYTSPADRTNPLAWPINAGPEDMQTTFARLETDRRCRMSFLSEPHIHTTWLGIIRTETANSCPITFEQGMKPVFIAVNELDPLRDQGMEMYRNLQHGGVKSELKVIGGTTHDGQAWLGGLYLDTEINSMKSFAAGLRGKILVEADKPLPEVGVKSE